jgi:hypothetical protein
MSLFRNNRQRLISRIQENYPALKDAFIILQGGVEIPFNDTDISFTFRQVCILVPSIFCPMKDGGASYLEKIFRKNISKNSV